MFNLKISYLIQKENNPNENSNLQVGVEFSKERTQASSDTDIAHAAMQRSQRAERGSEHASCPSNGRRSRRSRGLFVPGPRSPCKITRHRVNAGGAHEAHSTLEK